MKSIFINRNPGLTKGARSESVSKGKPVTSLHKSLLQTSEIRTLTRFPLKNTFVPFYPFLSIDLLQHERIMIALNAPIIFLLDDIKHPVYQHEIHMS